MWPTDVIPRDNSDNFIKATSVREELQNNLDLYSIFLISLIF
jgi:hypothetical protein